MNTVFKIVIVVGVYVVVKKVVQDHMIKNAFRKAY